MIIITSNEFDRQFRKQPQKIKDEFRVRIAILKDDFNNKTLNIHRLSGKLKDLWSFNVSGDIRVIFDREQKDVLMLVAIGSHSKLYS